MCIGERSLTKKKKWENMPKNTYGCNQWSDEMSQLEVIEQKVPTHTEYIDRSDNIANGQNGTYNQFNF